MCARYGGISTRGIDQVLVSKDTHLDWLWEAWSKVINPTKRDDPQSKGSILIEVEDEDLVDAWGGDDDLDDAFEGGGWGWEEEGFWWRGFSFEKWRKGEEMKRIGL